VRIFAMALGLAVFVALWAFIAKFGRIPDPLAVSKEAVRLFADPFYRNGPNDQGIGWNVLQSLGRVGIGFGLAALIGIPMGFMIGRFRFLADMAAPIIALLKPVSPLAWLPIGLLVFKAANPASIWVIFICIMFLLPQAQPITISSFNYTPVVFIVVLGGAALWYAVSAKNWFKGPKVQGTPEELAEIERDLEIAGA